ncbi:MAG: alpha/beta hydrolase [Bdellovibrionaceae bacterium]|nr:alpha/beta hydrolase [Pseudobdellovibrionaceae bacterium]
MDLSSTELTERTLHGWPISYRVVGNGRRKILFFHGFPGSSVQVDLFRKHCPEFDLQVLCLDRPGYNGTEARGGDHFDETCQVVERVLQELEWSEFEIFAVSGGTPFAFSCLQRVPEKVQRLTILCGLGPVTRDEFQGSFSKKSIFLLRLLPLLPGTILKRFLEKVANAQGEKRPPFFDWLMPTSKADQNSLRGAEMKSALRLGLLEAVRQDSRGPLLDAAAFVKPWPAERGSYQGPISLWHGEEDRMIPTAVAKVMQKRLDPCSLHLVPGEGHYSLPLRKMGQILRETL